MPTVTRNPDNSFTVVFTAKEATTVQKYHAAKGVSVTAAVWIATWLGTRIDEMAAWVTRHAALRRQDAYQAASGAQQAAADAAIGFVE